MAQNRKDNISKGLNAVLRNINAPSINAPSAAKEPTNIRLPLACIRPNPNQPRKDFNEKSLAELADSIRQVGIIQPITVRKITENEYEIISGERRYRAAKMAALTDIPVYLLAEKEEASLLAIALLENLQRSDLNPIEIALTYQRLIEEHQYTHESLAQKMSRDRSNITNHLRLLKLPPTIQASVREGNLSMGHARALLSLNNVEQQLFASQEIIKNTLSVRQTEKLCESFNKKSKPSLPSSPTDASSITMDALSEQLSQHFNTKAQVQHHKGKGTLTLHYHSIEELNAILSKIGIHFS